MSACQTATFPRLLSPMITLASIFVGACGGKQGSGKADEDTASGPPGDVVLSATGLDFGVLHLGESTSQSLSIRNAGEAALQLFDISFEDDTQRPHWTLGGGLSGELGPSQETTLVVTAHPVSLDDPSVRIEVQSDDPDSPKITLRLDARVVGEPELRLDPEATLDLGTVEVGAEGQAELHIANDGTSDLEINTVELVDDTPAGWSIVVNAEGTTIPARQEGGLVIVRFAPTAAGASTAVLHIRTNDPDEPTRSVALIGQT